MSEKGIGVGGERERQTESRHYYCDRVVVVVVVTLRECCSFNVLL